MGTVNFKHISIHTTPDESPGYLLWRVSMQWRSSIEKVLKPFHLTHPQFVILAALGWLTKDGNTVNQLDIGRMAGLDPNTTSQILRGLDTKKLIKRIHSVDARSKNPIVTSLGSEILSKALPAVEKADVQFFNNLNTNESQALISLFHKLIAKN